MGEQTTDAELKALISTILLAQFSSGLSQLGQNLSGCTRRRGKNIIVGIKTGGVDMHLFEVIIHSTLAVLGPVPDERDGWHTLTHMRSQAIENGAEKLVGAEGNPKGVDTNLSGIYAQTWQAIVERLV